MRDLERESALRSITDQVDYLKSELGNGRTYLRRTGSADARLRASGGGEGGGGGGAGPSDPTGGSVDAASTQAERNEEQMDGWDDAIAQALDLLAKVALDVDKVLRPPEEPAPKQVPLRGCISCARDRETKGNKEPFFERVAIGRYSQFCRPCGEYYAAEKELPPLGAVVWMHKFGKRWTTKVLAEARRDARAPRRKGA